MTKTEINKETVLKAFLMHETSRIPLDCFALKIISSLCSDSTLKYYKVFIDEIDFKNIVLPRHDHEIDFIPEMGLDIESSCKRFNTLKEQNMRQECFKKIYLLKGEIEKNELKEDSTFILLSNNKDLIHPDNHYKNYSSEKLFIANGFHRLMATGLIYFETGKLINLNYYYAETSQNSN